MFVRSAEDQGWDEAAARTLDPRDPLLEPVLSRRPFGVDAKAATRNRLPGGLMQPIVAVPVGDRFRCLALALYGPHATGNDLNHDERAMLEELAEKAACAFIKLDHDQLSTASPSLNTNSRLSPSNSAPQGHAPRVNPRKRNPNPNDCSLNAFGIRNLDVA